MKKKRIKIPTYTGWIYIFLFEDKEELIKKFPKETNTNGWCYKQGDYSYVMVTHKNCLTSTIVHESIHLVSYIFEHHGVKLDTKNDEHQAYFTTWVFEECEKFIKASNK